MENKIVYQIYPKSFNDTNHDGIGDIRGIIEKLDYLSFLGVDVLWITPVFKSPQKDNGYDVMDYYNIDPIFGTLDDIDELIKQAAERKMIIMFDMVFNHSSTEHPWFQKALSGDRECMSRYFFTKDKVNWESKFGGSAFQYIESLDMYYLHLFDETQADFNWDNKTVFDEFVKICNYWIERGIRGFRFDVINLISKPDVFEDSDDCDGRNLYSDGPKVVEYIRQLGAKSFRQHKDVLTVGELSNTSIQKATQYSKKGESGLDTIFNFHHLKVDYKNGNKWELMPFDFLQLKCLYREWQEGMLKEDASMSLFLSNHDQPRAISRFTDESFYGQTMLTNLIMSLRGVVFLYQGEEIGLPNAYFDTIDAYRDIESINYYNILKEKHDEQTVLKILQERSRDNGRTPMPWDRTVHYGFSTVEPWLSVSKANNLKTVSDNLDDAHSIFHYTKHVIQLRKHDEVLIYGDIEFVDIEHEQLFVYKRFFKDTVYLCIHNFYDKTVKYDFDFRAVILKNYDTVEKNTLRPFESLIVKL